MALHGKRLGAFGMLVLATACWALSFPAMKGLMQIQAQLLPSGSTWFMSAWCITLRFLLAALLVLVFCFRSMRALTRLEVEQGVGLALFGSIGLILQMDGLAYTKASTSAFLTQGYCLILPVIEAILQRRLPRWHVWVACALVIVGAGVLSEVNLRDFKLGRGEIETIAASAIFTGQILWLQRPKFAVNDVMRFTEVMFIALAVFALPVLVMTTKSASDLVTVYRDKTAIILMAVLVLLPSTVAYILMNKFQPALTATEAGLVYTCEPVFASTLALVVPAWISASGGIAYSNESLTTSLMVGGGMITGANVLVLMASPDSKPKDAQA